MGKNCTFIRMLANEDKGAALIESIEISQKGEASSSFFTITPDKFFMVPGSPFAYWIPDKIRFLFVNLPPFESDGREVKAGLCTGDDFRFIRLWWEVDPSEIIIGYKKIKQNDFFLQTSSRKKWVHFAKGGEYSPFYADIYLVVNWKDDGKEIKEGARNGTLPGARPQNTDYYFHPGLTWPLRTQLGFNIRQCPLGSIFGHKGPVAFVKDYNLFIMLGLMNSSIISQLISLQMAFGSFEVGVIQKTPIPKINEEQKSQLDHLVHQIIHIKSYADKMNETSHIFNYPSVIQYKFKNITELAAQIQISVRDLIKEGNIIQDEIDEISFNIYDICDSDKESIRMTFSDRPSPINAPPIDSSFVVADLFSYSLGAIFGRWDVRYATGETEPPELPDPFAPLLACSHGMLQGEDDLPLKPHEIPADYPIKVDPDGILVDDEGHSDDIIARIRDVLTLIWSERDNAIEKEACEILGVKSLRDYFRKPTAGGFWDDHVKRYSKSRRKAPIYWLLQSAKKNYAIWIYYPRMDGDTLYKALRYAKDKLAMEERRLEDMKGELSQFGTGGAAVKRLEKEIDGQEAFISELHDFVEKLERAANLDLIPEHDDGVVLTIAPLHELVPWKEPKKYWDELIEGKYEWSSIGKQLAEKGMVRRS